MTMEDPLFNDNAQPMWIYDRRTRAVLAVNRAAIEFYGYGREEFLRMRLDDIQSADDLASVNCEITAGVAGPRGSCHRRKDGDSIHVKIHSTRYPYQGCDAVLAVINDITEHRNLVTALHREQEYFRQLFEGSPDAIVILDSNDRVVSPNVAFQNLFGYSALQARGRSLNDLIVPAHLRDEASSFSARALANQTVAEETVRQTRDGHLLDVHILGCPVFIDGQRVSLYAIYRDITERRKMVAKIAYQATHDALTGLVNRGEFERRAARLITRGRERGCSHAMLFMDLDQFKVINDTCGHPAGDELLRQLSRDLNTHVRDSDTLARLGGDEFGLLLADCSLADAQRVGQELIDIVHRFRFRWGKHDITIGVSIGLVPVDEDGDTLADVLSAADAACYTAKERGRNRLQVYSASDETLARHRGQLAWVTRINRALEEERFRLYYQKIEPLAESTGRHYYEIFVRMLDESGDLVPPDAFIPAAERYNLMPRIDRWVIAHAFAKLRSRLDEKPERHELAAINVSGTSLSDECFTDDVADLFESQRLPAGCVCFEITETAAVSDMGRAFAFIDRMHALGIEIALDDFGTGMSSFSYLRSMQVDYLKIDGTFVRSMVENPVDHAMIEAINGMGQVMGVRTIAEFVESPGIRERLRSLGVDFAQGYAVHRPEAWDAV